MEPCTSFSRKIPSLVFAVGCAIILARANAIEESGMKRSAFERWSVHQRIWVKRNPESLQMLAPCSPWQLWAPDQLDWRLSIT